MFIDYLVPSIYREGNGIPKLRYLFTSYNHNLIQVYSLRFQIQYKLAASYVTWVCPFTIAGESDIQLWPLTRALHQKITL